MPRPNWYTFVGWFDIILGFLIATRAPFAEHHRTIFWSILSYGAILLLCGVVTNMTPAPSRRSVNLMRVRALLYSPGAIAFAYLLALPMWTTEVTVREDLVFFALGLAFFGLNSAISIWLSHRLA